jgi:hypothetical protein
MVGFISGSMNYVSLPGTNHNVKNARYQLIGGLLCAVIGSYVLDPWYLKMANIHQQLWRIDDYASDAIVLSLASVKTIQALHSYTKREAIKYNVGNHAVMVVLLVFLQLCAYAVNANCPTVERQSIIFIYHVLVVLIVSMQHDDCQQMQHVIIDRWDHVSCCQEGCRTPTAHNLQMQSTQLWYVVDDATGI